LVTREAIDVSFQRYKSGHREELNALTPASIRLTECQFASVVTDETLKFELPTAGGATHHDGATTDRHERSEATQSRADGSVTDTTAMLVSETDAAVQFGRDLFEALWAESDPIGPYIERHVPDLWE